MLNSPNLSPYTSCNARLRIYRYYHQVSPNTASQPQRVLKELTSERQSTDPYFRGFFWKEQVNVFAETSDKPLPGYRLSNREEKNKQCEQRSLTTSRVVFIVRKDAPVAKNTKL